MSIFYFLRIGGAIMKNTALLRNLLARLFGSLLYPISKILVTVAVNPVVGRIDLGEIDPLSIPLDINRIKRIQALAVCIAIVVLDIMNRNDLTPSQGSSPCVKILLDDPHPGSRPFCQQLFG
jgi:hypothetical protein